jgi:hypothetical protein
MHSVHGKESETLDPVKSVPAQQGAMRSLHRRDRDVNVKRIVRIWAVRHER